MAGSLCKISVVNEAKYGYVLDKNYPRIILFLQIANSGFMPEQHKIHTLAEIGAFRKIGLLEGINNLVMAKSATCGARSGVLRSLELRDLKVKQFEDHHDGYRVNFVPIKQFTETKVKIFLFG